MNTQDGRVDKKTGAESTFIVGLGAEKHLQVVRTVEHKSILW